MHSCALWLSSLRARLQQRAPRAALGAVGFSKSQCLAPLSADIPQRSAPQFFEALPCLTHKYWASVFTWQCVCLPAVAEGSYISDPIRLTCGGTLAVHHPTSILVLRIEFYRLIISGSGPSVSAFLGFMSHPHKCLLRLWQ